MRPSSITLTGSGGGVTNTDPLRVNWRVGTTTVQLDTDGSTTGFTVQYTLTPPDGYASASAWGTGAVWAASSISAATADAAATIAGSIQGVRLQANASGTDTGVVWVSQSDD